MFCLPIRMEDGGSFTLYVFLEEDNLERMRGYDPAVVKPKDFGPAFERLRVSEIVIGYAAPADLERVMALCHANKPQEALRYMTRGFRYRPDRGDHDGPYLSIKPSKERPS